MKRSEPALRCGEEAERDPVLRAYGGEPLDDPTISHPQPRIECVIEAYVVKEGRDEEGPGDEAAWGRRGVRRDDLELALNAER